MTPRKGQFQAGNPGGPGRPRKHFSGTSEDEICPQILIEMYSVPPVPMDSENVFWRIEYENRMAEYISFGYWIRKVSIPAADVNRLLKVFRAGRMVEPSFTMRDAYNKLYGNSRVGKEVESEA